MQRMQRKERGHQGAAPERARQALEQPEQQQAVDDVQQQTRDVVAAGPEPVNLAVQHVRQPRQRMPIAGVHTRERPLDASQRQASLDARVAADIVRVVKVDESLLCDGPVHAGGYEREQQADNNRLLALRTGVRTK